MRNHLTRIGLILAVLVVGLVLLRPWASRDESVEQATGSEQRDREPILRGERPILRGERAATAPPASDSPLPDATRTVRVRVVFGDLPDAKKAAKRVFVGVGPTGKRDRQREVWHWVDDGATVSMEVPVSGPLQVRCAAAPWASEGILPEIPVTQDEVTIRLVAACSLGVVVTDASSELPVLGDMEIIVEDVANGEHVATGSSADHLRSFLEPPRLRVGTYRLSVVASGYQPWTSEEVRLDHPGARATVEAQLSPTSTVGRLVLDLDPPNGGTLESAWVHTEVMRRGTKDASWKALPPRTLDETTHTATLSPLGPGDYRVLVWAGRDLVGVVEDVTVHANQTVHARVQLGQGLLIPLSDLPWKPAFYSDSRAIAVSTGDGVTLPTLYFGSRLPAAGRREWFMSNCEFRDERPQRAPSRANSEGSGLVAHDAVLGPYPCETVMVREADGPAKREHTFTRK